MHISIEHPDWSLWGGLVKGQLFGLIPALGVGFLLQVLMRRNPSSLVRVMTFFMTAAVVLPAPLLLDLTPVPKMTLVGICFMTVFRALEYLQGNAPCRSMYDSLANNQLYFGSTVEIEFENGKPTPNGSGVGTLLKGVWPERSRIGCMMAACLKALILSQLLPWFKGEGGDYAPTPYPLLNSYVGAWSIYLYTAMFVDLLGISLANLGVRGIVTFKNPLTMSVSPIDFWGRRWNLVIHGLIKRSIFQPLFKGGLVPAFGSKHIQGFLAAMTGFFVSGIFHEYLCHLTFYPRYYNEMNLHHMKFFLIQGILTSGELMTRKFVFSTLGIKDSDIPRIVRVIYTTLLLMPTAYLFLDPMTKYGLFDDISNMVPAINIRL